MKTSKKQPPIGSTCSANFQTLTILFLLLIPLLPASPAQAVDKSWVGGNDWWDIGTSWSPTGQPGDGDSVYLTPSDTTNRTVSYRNTAYPSAVLSLLKIDAAGSGTITLSQTQDPLAATDETIGYSGTASFNQSGGTHTATHGISLGTYSGALGTYDLSGTGSLSAGTEALGWHGTGAFTQSGGTNTVTDGIYLGFYPGALGTYDLTGAGNLSAGSEYVGEYATGIFTQSGGTNSITYLLSIGSSDGGSGTYNLSGTGSLSTAGWEIVGDENFSGGAILSGTGAFIQSGGTNETEHLSVGGGYHISSTATGTYDLTGTGSLSATWESIGPSGTGTFTQSSGTNTVTNDLILGGGSTGNGTYNLSGTGSMSTNRETIGTGIFTQSGGIHTVANTLTIAGSSGTYKLSGGSLAAATIQVNVGGTFDFTDGRLSVTTFNGDLTNAGGTLAPGASPGSTTVNGDYTVTDPAAVLEVEIAGLLTSEYDHVSVTGTATVDGILDVAILDGFSPNLGETFDILTADTVDGLFTGLAFPTFDGRTFEISYLLDPVGTDIVRLAVVNAVPEPASMALVGTALFGWLGLRRRRA